MPDMPVALMLFVVGLLAIRWIAKEQRRSYRQEMRTELEHRREVFGKKAGR